MMDTATTLLCIICQHREYERAHVCEADRASIPATLNNILSLSLNLDPSRLMKPAGGPRVSGGNVDPAVPINIDHLDLAAPASGFDHEATPYPADQIGHLSVATVLKAWCREFRTWRGRTEAMPQGHYAGWLDARTEWACDAYPHVGKYVTALRQLEKSLRHATGVDDSDTHPVGPCPMRCGGTLRANPWQDSAECPKCKKRWERKKWGTIAFRAKAA